ncbi:uncharacterized protein TrAtP1_008327 [Trichoderma atroviride]|uniref:uncharacterized protein n=1 Tax=Hypocrea atroviridis TaxID=63577 RepID=UPI0033347152|nr:hypothetical protein TrAtP1_008327 [Trichoderma atroviride]
MGWLGFAVCFLRFGKGFGKGEMEYAAVSGGTAQKLVASPRKRIIMKKEKDGISSRSNASRIDAWRATVSSFSIRGSASPESFNRHRLPPFDLDEIPLDGKKALTGPIKPNQFLSPPSSPPSFCSTIQDSEATDPLSTGPSQSVRQLYSTGNPSSTTLLSVDIHECILSAPKSSYKDFEPP